MVAPDTKDYFTLQELLHNAILADVVQATNLGRSPQQTISTALEDRFKGYPTDFVGARRRDHTFAIFLP